MNTAWFESGDPAGGWDIRLEGLVSSHRAHRLDQVQTVLSLADQASRDGKWAAVAVAYEAAPAFEPTVRVVRRSVADPPLVWVGIYRSGRSDRSDRSDRSSRSDGSVLDFAPSVGAHEFGARVRAAQEHIRAGDTYQVNLTFPMRAESAHDPDGWYEHLRQAQRARYCAKLDLDSHLVLSFSPELFFERRGDLVRARPMKGTSRRGRWMQEDERLARALATSEKERAENVMIVDLMRSDIGRVARAGTVRTPELFRLEQYPTLWQMTSTVEGHLPPGTTLVDLFRALFPCGSVTGAPKIRSMEIIAALEQQPRGLYTGAIGFVQPGGDCTFNVVIRTIVIDRETGRATLGVGAGITADSLPRQEYEESLLKASFARTPTETPASFALLETMRLEDGVVARRNRHLSRMADSARYFEFSWDDARVRAAIDEACGGYPSGCWRLRLEVDSHGVPTVACTAHDGRETQPWRIALATDPVDDRSALLFNKTTNRAVYEAARRARPDVDDVVLWNQRGEITESTIANLVAEIDGVRVTPPITCGLLPGTYRAELLDAGAILERVLTKDDLARASRIWLINSLRGWIEATLVS